MLFETISRHGVKPWRLNVKLGFDWRFKATFVLPFPQTRLVMRLDCYCFTMLPPTTPPVEGTSSATHFT